MEQVVVVGAVRTPIGRHNGCLSTWRPDDLAAHVLNGLMQQTGLEKRVVDEIVLGCVMQVGEQALNIARRAALIADFPPSVSALTIDYQCGSSLRAIQIASAQIQTGVSDVIIAGGVESMTRVPLGATSQIFGEPISSTFRDKYDLVTNGVSADMIAERWNIQREECDQYSLRSHRLALAAAQQGRFSREILPVPRNSEDKKQNIYQDEGIRADTTLEKLASLRHAFTQKGPTTAGSSSQISDGAAAVLLMSHSRAKALGLKPLACIDKQIAIGSDPVIGLTGPIDATKQLLRESKCTISDIDLFEINEAFASVVLAWGQELEPDMSRVNVNGGAIALGHPLGCTGVRLLTTLVHEMRRRRSERGLVALCCNGGLGVALMVRKDASD